MSVVASAITKGTFTNRANVFARSVFPVLKTIINAYIIADNNRKSHIHAASINIQPWWRIREQKRLPEPVGPIRRILLFSSSTASSSSMAFVLSFLECPAAGLQ